MNTYKEFKFISTYYLAAGIRETIMNNDPPEIFHIFSDLEYIQDRCLKPSKDTLLHDLIEYYFVESFEVINKAFSGSESIEEWRKYLDAYKIAYPSYAQFLASEEINEGEENDFLWEYSNLLEKLVEKEVTSLVAREVFSILFRDRIVLMEFNKLLREVITEATLEEYPELLEKNGMVKRPTYWPQWLKNALYYRDQGSCAICLKDISGLLKVDFERRIDHIVPLKLGGTNDITNLQLLCDECNLKKLDHTIVTSEIYSSYF